MLNFLDRQLLSILAKPIQDELGVTDGQLGLITGLYFALFYCILAIPIGWLADRTNRVRILSLAIALWSAATAACGLATQDTFHRFAPEPKPLDFYGLAHLNARGNLMIASLLAATLPALLAKSPSRESLLPGT